MMNNFGEKMLFHELETAAAWMQRNDPNGEYTAIQLFNYPMEHIAILEQWKEDLGYESTEKERSKIDALSSILYAVELAKNEK